ncbi:MAG: hypothetical protein ACK5Q5_21910 [Planctomycetaceae bacterium]
MSEFLTVKAAAQLVGKSPSSIRRLIYPIIEAESHRDRDQIRPSAADVPQLRLKGENFAWQVSRELLLREMPPSEPGETKGEQAGPRSAAGAGEQGLIETLRRELEIKNSQITQQGELISRQMDLIDGLSERLREGNVLIGTLQQRLAPPKPSEEGIVEAATANSASSSKNTSETQSPSRRRFFGLFRSRT